MTSSSQLADQKVQRLVRGAMEPSVKSLTQGIIPKPIIEKLVSTRNMALAEIGERIGTHSDDYFKKYMRLYLVLQL